MFLVFVLSFYAWSGDDFLDRFSKLDRKLWRAENGVYKCNQHFGACSGAIANSQHVEFNSYGQKDKMVSYMELWLSNDCVDLSPPSQCCPKGKPCTPFTAGTVQSRESYGHGTFTFMAKPVTKSKGSKKPHTVHNSQIDVFLIREGLSTASGVRHLAASGQLLELKDGSTVTARNLEVACSTKKFNMGITQADCDKYMTDARLSREGLAQARALYTYFNQWARSSSTESAYLPEDGLLMISPLRRAAVTGMLPFKDNLHDMCIEVEFDLRELQHTYSDGIFPENTISDYPHDLQQYFIKMDFPEVHVSYMSDIYDAIEGKVLDTYENDGCPKDPNFFRQKIQNMANAASVRDKHYIVISTHGNVIKCMNREFHFQQTGGIHDETNPFFRFGWHLIGNGAVERVVWDTTKQAVVGSPELMFNSWHVYAINQARVWKIFNSQWPKPRRLPDTANGKALQEPKSTPFPSDQDVSFLSCCSLTGKIGFEDFEISMCFSSENPEELHTSWGLGLEVRKTTVNLRYDPSKVVGTFKIKWDPNGISWIVGDSVVAQTSLKSNNPNTRAKINMYIRPLIMDEKHLQYEPNSILQRFEIFGAGYQALNKDELIVIGRESFQNEMRLIILVSSVFFIGGLFTYFGWRRNTINSVPDGYEPLQEENHVSKMSVPENI